MAGDGRASTAAGIARSIRIYHRDAGRTARMDALNALFLRPGGLAFDIGAHVGDRTASFRRLGARVVAAEPQPAALRALRLMFRRDPEVTLVAAAVGAAAGRITLHLNTRNPTVSTVSPGFIAAAQGAPGWEGQDWDRAIEVPVVTLDDLVARHGLPDFVKIDVEGHEAAVLAGLSRPVPALSFEFTTIQRDRALEALDQVARLGSYRFNVSVGEAHALEFAEWTDAAGIAAYLRDTPQATNAGDVFAVRL
jgi:FkbM family methyltransferase